MKKQRLIILVISVLLIATIALCACNEDEREFSDYVSDMKSSSQSAKTVTTHIAMYDGDVLVYEYQRNMQIDGTNATVETTEKKLSASFKLDTTTSVDQKQDVDKTALLPVALSEWSVTNVSLDGDSFTCSVTAENFASVMKLGSYQISEDATLKCEFSGEKIKNISCNFKTSDGKSVSVVYGYEY